MYICGHVFNYECVCMKGRQRDLRRETETETETYGEVKTGPVVQSREWYTICVY